MEETQRENDLGTGTKSRNWTSAFIAGLAAGAVMGIPIQFVMNIMTTIGALYGVESLAAGWAAHLFHSAVFALIFAGVVAFNPIKRYAGNFPSSLVIGLGYGVVIWVFGGVIMMPIWLESAGMKSPGVPNINMMSLMGHLVYGAILGAGYPAVLKLRNR